MALEPFRFVHAADLRLDAPLVGLGRLDGDVRRLAEDATLVAFDRVLDACVKHHADFLLLTGPLWFKSLTPRAWSILASAARLLAEYGVRAFCAGDLPPSDDEARLMLAELENLTLLPESDPDPVAIVKEGRVVASLSTCDPRRASQASLTSMIAAPTAARAFQIRVLPSPDAAPEQPAATDLPDGDSEVELAQLLESAAHAGIDYLALCSGSRRLLRAFEGGVMHHPGSAQGVDASEPGPHGCSLVEVDAEGACRVVFLPTAAVRWEHLRMGVDRDMSRPQLVDRMQQVLLEQENATGERLLCVHWLLVGSGPLFNALDAGDATESLTADIDAGLPPGRDVTRRHVFSFRRRIGTGNDPLTQDFLDVLAEQGAEGLEDLSGAIAKNRESHWTRHLLSSLPRQSNRAVVETANRLGRDWLQNSCPGGE